MTRPVTLQMKGGNSKHLAAELARITGREVVFQPSVPDDTFSLDIKNAPLWDVLEILSASGQMRIGGEDFAKLKAIRKALVGGEKMAVCIRSASVQQVVNEFANLSGLRLRITSGDAEAIVNLSVKEVTLEDVLAKVSEQTGVQITKQ